jgi:hypothetical protein
MFSIRKAGYAVLASSALAAGILATAGAASASTGPNGNQASLTGNGAAVYTDPLFGPVQCNETQHAKFDTVECQFTGGQTFAPGSAGTYGWISDFAGSGHSTGVITYTIKPDGLGYSGKATYPNG